MNNERYMGRWSGCNEFEELSCEHGRPLGSCTTEQCPEICRLYYEALDEGRKDKNGSIYARNALKRRGKKKSEYEIALEKLPFESRNDYELELPEDKTVESDPGPRHSRKVFQNIFSDEMTFRAALQYRALSLRQACLVKAYMASDDSLPNYKRWAAIGRRIGRSGKTVGREFLKLVDKFLKTNASNCDEGATVTAVHVRGERRPRYYRRHSIRIGEWRRELNGLITDETIIRELRRKGVPMIRYEKTPIPSSSVNRLLGALIRHFASDLPRPATPERPEGISEADWEENLNEAEHRLKRKSPGPWTALEVYRILGRGAGLCRGCRTLLIRGFMMGKRKITRAREFCDDGCKMRAERRKTRSANPPSSHLA